MRAEDPVMNRLEGEIEDAIEAAARRHRERHLRRHLQGPGSNGSINDHSSSDTIHGRD
jgi:hypothetical protein